ncbi:MAG: lyase family protein [Planctomycetota bacterium]
MPPPDSTTNSANDTYTSPLASRNASPEMLRLWSPRHKFNTWRRIWLAIAEAQHEVTKDWGSGDADESEAPLPDGRGSSKTGPLVTKEQVEELRAVVEQGITDEELARASEIERDLRHDVMAHVHCLGEQCPKAKPIIHLGCTSQDVVCNADWESINQSAAIIEKKLAATISLLADGALQHRKTPTLGFTHYQAAQPVTVGRRCGGWAYELWMTMKPLDTARICNRPRGIRGATGTCASIMKLFDSRPQHGVYDGFQPGWRPNEDGGLTKEGTRLIEERYEDQVGFRLDWDSWNDDYDTSGYHDATHRLTGQTYPRVADGIMLSALASTAAVLHKIATDIRLLSNRKELDEPFGKNQIGSSAMPYKRNPMKCERICGLTRFVMNLVGNAYDTAATQWLERTLDDSSNRRLSLPEAFLALDGALDLMHQVASGLVVNEAMVRKNLMEELPFLATENILMEAVKAGGDRQDLHEKIRVHAQAAGHRVKQEGLDNDLIDRLRNDPAFASVHHLLTEEELLDPMKYVGRSVEQTERFIAEVIEPMRERYADELAELGESDRGV